ncbi:hypothetical protein [Sedimenticola hydrogenitrophicus]|uniref:hypothetical protein n=1 Tax=Sedimenticola hydrogenitrophicus TaxID=2967975 RepID=UPI0021A4A736|nr:hypothetical protein [Sedimenticola hydrogenitrophicus]
MQSPVDKLLKKHRELVQSDGRMVASHVQREQGEWIINTLMIAGQSVPFIYKRRRRYKSLQGQRVNITYYPTVDAVAGIEFEVMKVVRIRVA